MIKIFALAAAFALGFGLGSSPAPAADKADKYTTGFHGGTKGNSLKYRIALSTKEGARCWIDIRPKLKKKSPGLRLTFRF